MLLEYVTESTIHLFPTDVAFALEILLLTALTHSGPWQAMLHVWPPSWHQPLLPKATVRTLICLPVVGQSGVQFVAGAD